MCSNHQVFSLFLEIMSKYLNYLAQFFLSIYFQGKIYYLQLSVIIDSYIF